MSVSNPYFRVARQFSLSNGAFNERVHRHALNYADYLDSCLLWWSGSHNGLSAYLDKFGEFVDSVWQHEAVVFMNQNPAVRSATRAAWALETERRRAAL